MIFNTAAFNPLRNEIKAQRERLTSQDGLANVLNTLEQEPVHSDNWILVNTLVQLNNHNELSPAAWCTLTSCAQHALVIMLQAYMRGEFRHHRAKISQLQQRYSYE